MIKAECKLLFSKIFRVRAVLWEIKSGANCKQKSLLGEHKVALTRLLPLLADRVQDKIVSLIIKSLFMIS